MHTLSLMMPIIATYKYRMKIDRESTVAKRLKVEPSALSNYKNGLRRMPDMALIELANGTGIELREIIAAMNISLEKTPDEEKAYWLEQIKSDSMKSLAKGSGFEKYTDPKNCALC